MPVYISVKSFQQVAVLLEGSGLMPLGNHEMLSEAGVEHHLGLIAIRYPGDLDALNLGVLQNLAEKIPV